MVRNRIIYASQSVIVDGSFLYRVQTLGSNSTFSSEDVNQNASLSGNRQEKLGHMLETHYSLQDHCVIGNDERDGLKTCKIWQSAGKTPKLFINMENPQRLHALP